MVTLERNYRATQPLLDVANAVAAQATRAFPQACCAPSARAARARSVSCRDQSAEADEVCDRVLAAREQGMLLREQAVLDAHRPRHRPAGARAVPPADPVRQVRRPALPRGRARQGLPRAAAAGRQRPPTRWPGSACCSCSRASGRPARAARSPAMRRREPTARDLLRRLRGVGAARARRLPPRRARAPTPLDRGAAAAREEPRPGPRAERLRDALAPLVAPTTPTARCACRTSTRSSAAAREATDLRHFVAELVLDPPASSADLAGPPHLDEDWLVLSTIHSAKGLEWQRSTSSPPTTATSPPAWRPGTASDRRGATAAVRRA